MLNFTLKGATLMKASKFAWWFAQIFGFIGGVSLIRGLMHGGVINYVACIVFFILWGAFQITHEILAKKGY